MQGLSLVATSGGHSSSRCEGLSLSRPLLLWSTGSRRAGSVVVAHGPSFSVACGIFPDQGSNPCPLHRQADSQPLRHQGSPIVGFNWGPTSIKFLELASAPLKAINPWSLPKVISNCRVGLKGSVPCPWVTSPPMDSYGRTWPGYSTHACIPTLPQVSCCCPGEEPLDSLAPQPGPENLEILLCLK